MPDEHAFLRRIGAGPADPVARLVYADWLAEQSDAREEYVRTLCAAAGWGGLPGERAAQVARLQDLRPGLDTEWLGAIQRGVPWRLLFEANLYPGGVGEYGKHYEFGDPATADEIAVAEVALELTFPAELRALLAEFNGVYELRPDGTRGDPHYLDTRSMVAAAEDLFEYADADTYREEFGGVVLVCGFDCWSQFYGLCTADLGEYPAGAVLHIDHGQMSGASHVSLAEFVRHGYK